MIEIAKTRHAYSCFHFILARSISLPLCVSLFFRKLSYFSIALTPMGMLNASQQLNDDRWKYFHCIGLFGVVLFRFMCAFMALFKPCWWGSCMIVRGHAAGTIWTLTGQCLNLYLYMVCCSLFSVGLSLLLFFPPSFSLSLFFFFIFSLPLPLSESEGRPTLFYHYFEQRARRIKIVWFQLLFNREQKLGLSFIQLVVLLRCAMCMSSNKMMTANCCGQ